MKFAFIEGHLAGAFPVELAGAVLEVSRSGYYAWLRRPRSQRAERRSELAEQVKAAHAANRGVYGSPRLCEALRAEGVDVCENTVAKLMRHGEIRAKAKRNYKVVLIQ